MSDNNLPIEQRSFERLNKALEKQKTKRPSIFSKLFSGWLSPPTSQDWVVDAQWEKMQQQPASAKVLLYIICFSLLALIMWAAFAHLDEVARGEGRVIPSHKLQVVQSYDGGMIEQIYVREGQIVNEGDVLIKIDPTRFISSFRENQAKILSLTAKVERLKALTQKRPLAFDPEIIEKAPEAIAHEQAMFESSNQELEQQVTIHKRQLEQRRQDYAEAKAALQQHTNSLSLANRELSVTRPLLRSGAVSDIDIIRLERRIVEHTDEINRTKPAITRTMLAINEANNKVTEVELAMNNPWINELSEA